MTVLYVPYGSHGQNLAVTVLYVPYGSHGQNLAVTVLHVPHSLDSGATSRESPLVSRAIPLTLEPALWIRSQLQGYLVHKKKRSPGTVQ